MNQLIKDLINRSNVWLNTAQFQRHPQSDQILPKHSHRTVHYQHYLLSILYWLSMFSIPMESWFNRIPGEEFLVLHHFSLLDVSGSCYVETLGCQGSVTLFDKSSPTLTLKIIINIKISFLSVWIYYNSTHNFTKVVTRRLIVSNKKWTASNKL